jgi:hypothetical protein
MRHYTLPNLKNFLSMSFLTGGFTLITAGFWNIFGTGAGLLAAGVLSVVMHVFVSSE